MDKPALLMEYVEGETIKDCGKFPIKDFLHASREIVSALSILHAEGVMHNNLTTSNILYHKETKTIKIIGFSSSSRFSVKNSFSGYRNLNQNMKYAPPETWGRPNQLVDFRADFYSLGVIFYYMISGNHPFVSEHTHDLLRKQIFDTEEALSSVDSNIPAALSDFVAKLMKKNAG